MVALDKDLQSRQLARELVRNAKQAQKVYATFSQEKIDSIVKHIAIEASLHAEELAKMANEETGFGKWQDKVLKNTFASLRVYEHIKDIKTIGIINDDKINKVMDVGVPLGVITALVPSTNPTSTIIYKTLIALKAGNAIVFSPHPNAKACSFRTLEIVKKAALEAGAPEGIIDGVKILTTHTLLSSALNEYNGLFVPFIDAKLVSEIANGLSVSEYSQIILLALAQNIPVMALKYHYCPESELNQVLGLNKNKQYNSLIKDNINKTISLGIEYDSLNEIENKILFAEQYHNMKPKINNNNRSRYITLQEVMNDPGEYSLNTHKLTDSAIDYLKTLNKYTLNNSSCR